MGIEIKVRPDLCCGGFFITAHLDGALKGLYMAHFDSEDSIGCHITSLQPYSGIPRALISKACEKLVRWQPRLEGSWCIGLFWLMNALKKSCLIFMKNSVTKIGV